MRVERAGGSGLRKAVQRALPIVSTSTDRLAQVAKTSMETSMESTFLRVVATLPTLQAVDGQPRASSAGMSTTATKLWPAPSAGPTFGRRAFEIEAHGL